MTTTTINGKKFFLGETRNICEICGTYDYRAFYKNPAILAVKKGKKVCTDCIERFESPELQKKEQEFLLK